VSNGVLPTALKLDSVSAWMVGPVCSVALIALRSPLLSLDDRKLGLPTVPYCHARLAATAEARLVRWLLSRLSTEPRSDTNHVHLALQLVAILMVPAITRCGTLWTLRPKL
jgi:hypothetical protein